MSNLAKLKAAMLGKVKLEELSRTDMRQAQQNVSSTVDKFKMDFQLKTNLLECMANMPMGPVDKRGTWPAGPVPPTLPQGRLARRRRLNNT